jgi:Transposase DDE domain
MELQIVIFYFFADEVLKTSSLYDDPQAKMTNAEIITAVLTAANFFYGNQRTAARFLKTHDYIPNFLSESHFNRRMHRIPLAIWQKLFFLLAEHFKVKNLSNEYVVDSFPVSVCDNIRIFRSKIFSGEQYRGYNANKKRFFYGLKVHVVTTTNQEPIEVLFAPGSEADMKVFKELNLDIPEDATLYADKAYNSYEYEDFLRENNLFVVAGRKANSKRPLKGCLRYLQNYWRKRIETTFSRITSLFPKTIHAVTSRGFELKVFAFILAYSINLAFK